MKKLRPIELVERRTSSSINNIKYLLSLSVFMFVSSNLFVCRFHPVLTNSINSAHQTDYSTEAEQSEGQISSQQQQLQNYQDDRLHYGHRYNNNNNNRQNAQNLVSNLRVKTISGGQDTSWLVIDDDNINKHLIGYEQLPERLKREQPFAKQDVFEPKSNIFKCSNEFDDQMQPMSEKDLRLSEQLAQYYILNTYNTKDNKTTEVDKHQEEKSIGKQAAKVAKNININEASISTKLDLPRPTNVTVLITSWYPPILNLSWHLDELDRLLQVNNEQQNGHISKFSFDFYGLQTAQSSNNDTSSKSNANANRTSRILATNQQQAVRGFDFELALDKLEDNEQVAEKSSTTNPSANINNNNQYSISESSKQHDKAVTSVVEDQEEVEMRKSLLEIKKRRELLEKSLSCFQVTYNIVNSAFKITEEYPPYRRSIQLDRLQPATKYQLRVSAIYLNKFRRPSDRVHFISPTDNESRRFKENTYRPIHSYPDERPTNTKIGLALVRDEELFIVGVALTFWIGTIWLFFNKWGRIRMLEPYQPAYREPTIATSAASFAVAAHQQLPVPPSASIGHNLHHLAAAAAASAAGAPPTPVSGGGGGDDDDDSPVSQVLHQLQRHSIGKSIGKLDIDLASSPTDFVQCPSRGGGKTLSGSGDEAAALLNVGRSATSGLRRPSANPLISNHRRFNTLTAGDMMLIGTGDAVVRPPLRRLGATELNCLFQSKASALAKASLLWPSISGSASQSGLGTRKHQALGGGGGLIKHQVSSDTGGRASALRQHQVKDFETIRKMGKSFNATLGRPQLFSNFLHHHHQQHNHPHHHHQSNLQNMAISHQHQQQHHKSLAAGARQSLPINRQQSFSVSGSNLDGSATGGQPILLKRSLDLYTKTARKGSSVLIGGQHASKVINLQQDHLQHHHQPSRNLSRKHMSVGGGGGSDADGSATSSGLLLRYARNNQAPIDCSSLEPRESVRLATQSLDQPSEAEMLRHQQHLSQQASSSNEPQQAQANDSSAISKQQQQQLVTNDNKLRRLQFLNKLHRHHHVATSASSSTLIAPHGANTSKTSESPASVSLDNDTGQWQQYRQNHLRSQSMMSAGHGRGDGGASCAPAASGTQSCDSRSLGTVGDQQTPMQMQQQQQSPVFDMQPASATPTPQTVGLTQTGSAECSGDIASVVTSIEGLQHHHRNHHHRQQQQEQLQKQLHRLTPKPGDRPSELNLSHLTTVDKRAEAQNVGQTQQHHILIEPPSPPIGYIASTDGCISATGHHQHVTDTVGTTLEGVAEAASVRSAHQSHGHERREWANDSDEPRSKTRIEAPANGGKQSMLTPTITMQASDESSDANSISEMQVQFANGDEPMQLPAPNSEPTSFRDDCELDDDTTDGCCTRYNQQHQHMDRPSSATPSQSRISLSHGGSHRIRSASRAELHTVQDQNRRQSMQATVQQYRELDPNAPRWQRPRSSLEAFAELASTCRASAERRITNARSLAKLSSGLNNDTFNVSTSSSGQHQHQQTINASDSASISMQQIARRHQSFGGPMLGAIPNVSLQTSVTSAAGLPCDLCGSVECANQQPEAIREAAAEIIRWRRQSSALAAVASCHSHQHHYLQHYRQHRPSQQLMHQQRLQWPSIISRDDNNEAALVATPTTTSNTIIQQQQRLRPQQPQHHIHRQLAPSDLLTPPDATTDSDDLQNASLTLNRPRMGSVFEAAPFARSHRDSFAMLRALSQKKSKSAEDVAYLSSLVLKIWTREPNPLLQSISSHHVNHDHHNRNNHQHHYHHQHQQQSSSTHHGQRGRDQDRDRRKSSSSAAIFSEQQSRKSSSSGGSAAGKTKRRTDNLRHCC